MSTVAERPVRRLGARDVAIRGIEVFGIGIRVAVWEGSNGRPPLLIFNGIGAGLEMLAPFADEMSDTTVIAFDVPGAGESEVPPVPYRLWMLGVVAGRVLDQLDVDRVDVLGVSWGGAAAQQFAVQNPRRCRRLVLAATTAGMVMVPPRWSVLKAFMTPRRHNDPTYLREVAPMIYGGRAVDPDVLKGFGRTSKRGYLLQQLALYGWTSAPWLPLVRQPTLVLAGGDDRVVRVANLRIIAALLPDAQLHVLDDGHLFVISSATQTADLVGDFLGENDPDQRVEDPLEVEEVAQRPSRDPAQHTPGLRATGEGDTHE